MQSVAVINGCYQVTGDSLACPPTRCGSGYLLSSQGAPRARRLSDARSLPPWLDSRSTRAAASCWRAWSEGRIAGYLVAKAVDGTATDECSGMKSLDERRIRAGFCSGNLSPCRTFVDVVSCHQGFCYQVTGASALTHTSHREAVPAALISCARKVAMFSSRATLPLIRAVLPRVVHVCSCGMATSTKCSGDGVPTNQRRIRAVFESCKSVARANPGSRCTGSIRARTGHFPDTSTRWASR